MGTARLSCSEKGFVVATCLALAAMISGMAVLAAFFPVDMAARGVSPVLVTVIFTSFEIARLITSVFASAIVSRLGRRPVLVCGLLCCACTSAAFGMIPDLVGTNISLMCKLFVVVRVVQGSGVALSQLCIFAILCDRFPDNRGLVIGAATSMLALGYFIGPPLGGFLYAASGFRMPFLVLSMFVASCIVPILCLFPKQLPPAASEPAAPSEPAAAIEPSSFCQGSFETSAPSGMRSRPKGVVVTSRWCGSPWRHGRAYCERVGALPQGVHLLAALSFFYMSKWAWWDLWFTPWCVDEFGFTVKEASLCIAFIAALFGLSSPLSGSLGDRLGNRRTMGLIACSMTALVLLFVLMGPWQLAWSVAIRQRLLFVYLAVDGLVSCLVEPQVCYQPSTYGLVGVHAHVCVDFACCMCMCDL